MNRTHERGGGYTSREDRWSRRRVLQGLGVAAGVLAAGRAPLLAREPRILMFAPDGSGDAAARQAEYAAGRFGEFGRRYGFGVEVERDGESLRRNLDRFDGFFFYGADTAAGIDMAPDVRDRLVKRVRRGSFFVGCHGAAGFFPSPGERRWHQEERDPFVAMMGGELVDRGPLQTAEVRVADPTFPGLGRYDGAFEHRDRWLSLKNFDPELHVVLVQQTDGLEGGIFRRPPYPLSWARKHGRGRVFYTALGADREAWDSITFRQSLMGGTLWATRDAEADLSSNLRFVAPRAILPSYPT